MATADDVATAILDRLGSMSAMKLEKLAYYCQCWHLARFSAPLFDDQIEAWREGPVVPALFRLHKGQFTVSSWPAGNAAGLNTDQLKTINWVLDQYGRFSPIELSRMAHRELPWRAARGALPDSAASSEPISLSMMRTFYSRQIADPETAATLAIANATLEGAEFDADWQDKLRDVASGTLSGDDLVAAEIARIKGV